MRGYVIATSPRSGSTLLCTLLRSSGVAGWPQSWFREQNRAEFAADWQVDPQDAAAYLRAAIEAGTRGTGIFALRMMWGSLAEVEPWLGRGLNRINPLQWVWLERRDKVAQAVSRHRAETSGIWHLGIEEAEFPKAPCYDFAAIHRYLTEAEGDAAGWGAWFAEQGVAPLRIFYEDLAADPVFQANRLITALGMPAGQSPAAGTKRMANRESADWASRYRCEAGLSLRS